MGKLSMGIVVAVFMTLLLASEGKSFKKRGIIQVVQTNDIFEWLCQNSQWPSNINWCPTTTAMPPSVSTSTTGTSTTTTVVSTKTTTAKSGGTTQQSSSTTDNYYEDTSMGDTTMGGSTSETAVETEGSASPTAPATTTTSGSQPSALERAHWCQFNNGSYVTLGQTFMYTACLLCQCTQSHAIFCNSLQCKPTYCANGSQPITSAGECCSHCEVQTPVACSYGGISFPSGSIIKSTANGFECWCQSGTIECRVAATSTLTASTTVASFLSTYSDYYGGGTPIYIIIVIICVLLIFGSLVCCGGAVVYYYFYYYQNQQAVQQAYDQYYTSAGWQPMGEDGQVIDENALEKQAEAEKGQTDQEYPTGLSQQYIPPPYAVYNGPYEKN